MRVFRKPKNLPKNEEKVKYVGKIGRQQQQKRRVGTDEGRKRERTSIKSREYAKNERQQRIINENKHESVYHSTDELIISAKLFRSIFFCLFQSF